MNLPYVQSPEFGTTSGLRRRLSAVVAVFAALAMLASGVLFAGPAQAQATQFVFQGRGWGHGVGMSQNGARNAADLGLDHVAILNHYYPNTAVAQPAPLGNIRVHLGDASRVEMSSAGSIVFERGGVAVNGIPAGTISVAAHDGGLQIGNAWTTATASDPVYVSFPLPVTVSNNGHSYLWGKFQLTNRDGKVRLVEDLPMEQYVAGIAEMPAAWPLEALKAQAIAARTYAHEVTLHRRNSTEWAQEYDISGSTVDQNYIGYDAQDSAWDQRWLAAVQATAGLAIVDATGPVRAYYSASNGGYTETAAYVFGNDVAHTVAGVDPYDAGGHDWTEWTRTYSQESISRWLNNSPDTAVGSLQAINVLGGAGASARLDKAIVELVGSAGTKQVTGRRMMVVINAGVFGSGGGLSTHLPGTFTTIGNGVGVGLPQPTGIQMPSGAVLDAASPGSVGAASGGRATPPADWQPVPGTGVAPLVPVASVEDQASSGSQDESASDPSAEPTRIEPPEDWVPVPGTGVAPLRPAGTESDVEVAPVAGTAPTEDLPSTTSSGSAPIQPPADWVPVPGTGVSPLRPVPSAGERTADAAEAGVPQATSAPAGSESGSATDNEPAPATANASVPPGDWVPVPGTGVPPLRPIADITTVGGTGGGDSLAGGVLLVSRSVETDALTDTTFEVIAPTSELAAEARARIEELQARATLGLFADVDANGYVANVAPHPVHGVCTATVDRVTCVPLSLTEGE